MSTNLKDVFVISEGKNDGKSHWSRIGVAFVNKDNSINVVLDAVPLSGKLNIRDRVINKKSELSNKQPCF